MVLVKTNPQIEAALVVQEAWRRYTSVRIYRYYRDLINFRSSGNPMEMLRCINPSEAALLEASSGAHVRFRLGGQTFPPKIYYKIYTHQPMCDVNAFAPKDYTRSKLLNMDQVNHHASSAREREAMEHLRARIHVGKSVFEAKFSEDAAHEYLEYTEGGVPEGWYRRYENNDWRPVTLRTVRDAKSEAEQRKEDIAERFHYSKVKRGEDSVKRQKRRKREWMRKLYAEGLAKERHQSEIARDKIRKGRALGGQEIGMGAAVDFDADTWEEEAEDLLTWTETLDFESYLDDWKGIGTSGPAEQDLEAKMSDEQLREILDEEDAMAGVGSAAAGMGTRGSASTRSRGSYSALFSRGGAGESRGREWTAQTGTSGDLG